MERQAQPRKFYYFQTLLRLFLLSYLFYPSLLFADSPVLTVDQTLNPIRVDGHLEDWPSARMILLNQSSQIVEGRAFWHEEDDFSGRVFLTYDSQYFYVGAIITKKGRVVNDHGGLSLGNGDCLEVFLSTNPHWKTNPKPSPWDYRIALSPGTDCKNPTAYCLNRNENVEKTRVVTRKTPKGYVLECAIPLEFLEGLELGPGKSIAFNLALDEGGPLGGNRIVRMDLAGNKDSARNPALWREVRWIGKTELSIPSGRPLEVEPGLIQDGTRGSLFWGTEDLRGKVQDAHGNPLAGALLSTWPRTKEAVSDDKGRFRLEGVKVYDKTVVYARKDGYAASLVPVSLKHKSLTVSLTPLEEAGLGSAGGLWRGLALEVSSPAVWESTLARAQAWLPALKLDFIRLSGMERLKLEETFPVLDRFLDFAKQNGLEPIVEVGIKTEPETAANWVRHCLKRAGPPVRYWAIGSEPDLDADGDSVTEDAGVYGYINRFRNRTRALKTADPGILVMGPEVAGAYGEAKGDWVLPFLKADGDIVNLVSIHHYACRKPGTCGSQAILVDGENMSNVLQQLRQEVSENTDVSVPLALTGGSVYPSGAGPVSAGTASFGKFSTALWVGKELENCLNQGIPLALFNVSSIGAEGPLLAGEEVPAACQVLGVSGEFRSGKLLSAVVQQPGIFAAALQDPLSRKVTLLVLNENDRYFRLKISLNGGKSDLSVEAGLDRSLSYEVPSFSISVLRLYPKAAGDQAWLYMKKMAETGLKPGFKPLKD